MIIERSPENPILKPNKDQSWEAEAVFNGCPVQKDGVTHLLYRAISLPHYHTLAKIRLRISDIGIARSKDGVHFEDRKRFIVPEYDWEQFGCEDPRVTELDGKYYIFYTAISRYPFNADGIKIGVAISRDLETIEEKHPVTPFNAKAMALFPERIGGKIWAVLTANTDRPPAKICVASFDKEEYIWSEAYWEKWYKNFEKHALLLQRKPEDHIEVGAPPVKTDKGWLMLYSYIRNYFSGQRLFGIEAALLDLKDPSKVIARTEYPILTSEEYYERIGIVPNVVFPSGIIMEDGLINLYYGAADTTCCLAKIELHSLLGEMLEKEKRTVRLARAKNNPIIIPNKERAWEAKATFNPAAIYLQGKVHILYRAMSEDNTSVLGYAELGDGVSIDLRSTEPAYVPRELFEQKLMPGGNSGCEDPRLTQIGERIYMPYTAFDGRNPPRVALTWITVQDFLKQKWNWSKPVTISPHDFDDKDAVLFPEKFNENYIIVHRIGDDIDLAFVPDLEFKTEKELEEYRWLTPRRGWWDSRKVGIAAPPIKTDKGWVLLYHGVSEEDGFYRVGAVLTDSHDPTKIIGRTDYPIFEPEADYEKKGEVPNVVFPCGAVVIGKTLFMYYGGGDQVVGVATMELEKLLEILEVCKC